MADWLLIRLARVPDGNASWLIANARGAPVGVPQEGPLSLAAPRAAGRRVCLLVPGTDVLLTEAEVPVKAGARLAQLVPYALEEHLADDIEELHFAIGKRVGDSPRAPVAVVARSLLQEWLTTLRAAGIEPSAIYADSDLLPENPGQAVALLEEDAVVVRPPGGAPVTLPAAALGEALDIALAGVDGGGRGLILYTGAAEWQQHSPQVEAARAKFDGIKVQLLTGGPLALFAQQLSTVTPINLLQGSYEPTSSQAAGLRAWRVAAMLLVALVGLHVAGKLWQLHALHDREHQVDASIRETFHLAMPGVPGTSDARHRMEQRLVGARGAGQGLLAALQALGQARDAAPGTSVQALTFRDGTLDLKLSVRDAASLDHVSQTLHNNGWQAKLTGGGAAGSAYEGRIQVRAGEPST
jgi:general secretion pathway protein L